MNRPNLVHSTNLSVAWAKTFLLSFSSRNNEFSSTLVSVNIENSFVQEDQRISKLLDQTFDSLNGLEKNSRRKGNKYVPISDNASLIFPSGLWKPISKRGYDHFFKLYEEKVFPRLKKADSRNRLGTYFLRMIPQLKIILDYWNQERFSNRRVRRSALQASCVDSEIDFSHFKVPVFDYKKDHKKTKMRGFPCLQQVSFCWNDDNELSVAAYYPTQYVFDRGYGNYLGLCKLGSFMANEMGLRFTKLNCFINVLELGSPSKGDVDGLCRALNKAGVTIGSEENSWKTA